MIIDFSSKKASIRNGSFYTALTRVKKGSDFHLKDFKNEYIQAEINFKANFGYFTMAMFMAMYLGHIYLSYL